MDCYDMIRTRFFANRKHSSSSNEDWLLDDETPFFLNSAGSEFKFLDLKHISDAMDCDVTAYSFRRIVCTWALCHENKEIRDAEAEALQHELKVARERYLQNKQIQPQKLTQQYNEEENLFSGALLEEIERTADSSQNKIKETEENRAKRRYENLFEERNVYKKSKMQNKPLGPKHRALGTHRNRFKYVVEMIQEKTTESSIRELKPLQWRRFIVRLLCTTEGENGNEVRKVWVRIYKGDLRWGVRDARLKSMERNWSRNFHFQDRNSWIASSIRKSLVSEKKVSDSKKYLKLI